MSMTAGALFLSTLLLVFFLGLQSLNVNSGRYAAAFVTSFGIGAANLALFKLAPGAVTTFEEWWPIVKEAGINFYDGFTKTWREMQPLVRDVTGAIKNVLKDPNLFENVKDVLRLYAVVKVGGMGMSLVSGGLGTVATLRNLGVLGGGASAATGVAGAAGGATGAAGLASRLGGLALFRGGHAAALGVSEVAGTSGTFMGHIGAGGGGGALSGAAGAVGAAGVGLTAMLAGIVTATIGALGAAGYEIASAQQRAQTIDAKGGGAYGYSAGEQSYVDQQVMKGIAAVTQTERIYRGTVAAGREEMGDRFKPPDFDPAKQSLSQYMEEVERLRVQSNIANDRIEEFATSTAAASEAASELGFIIKGLAKSGDFEAIAKINAAAIKAQDDAIKDQDDLAIATSAGMTMGLVSATKAIQNIEKQTKLDEDRKKKTKDALEGRGGITIRQINVTVSGVDDPGRIINKGLGELIKLTTHPAGASPRVVRSTP